MDPIEDLIACIKLLTEESWSNGEPLLLAKLGSNNQGDVSRQAKNVSGSVRNFIESHMTDVVKIVRHSHNKVVVAVVPLNEETRLIQDFDEMLSNLGGPQSEPHYRFAPAVWAAFKKPLEADHKRLLNLSRRSFSDRVVSHEIGAEEKEVPRDDLLLGEDVKDSEIHQQIVAWASKNSVNPALLTPDNLGPNIGRTEIGLLPKISVLDRLLFVLDTRDLEKTSMTLDVVKKLRANS